MANIKCPIPITKVNMPSDKYSIKCPYTMEPEEIAVHNTYNDASAMSEISYMIRNNNKVSFHFAVDNTRVVQGIDLNRNAWHAGDGSNGKGNRKAIAVEICYSKSGGDRFSKAEDNAAKFVAYLLASYGWGIEKVKSHKYYNGKNCPHRTLELGWDRFLDKVEGYLKSYTKEPIPTNKPTTSGTKYKIGDDVSFSKCYTSSTATSGSIPVSKMAKSHGKITSIYEGRNNPYLLDGDMCFVNDSCITGIYGAKKPTTTKPATPTSKTKYKIGDVVIFSKCYSSSTDAANKSIPASKMAKRYGKITKIYEGRNNPYLLDGDMCFVNDSCITGTK